MAVAEKTTETVKCGKCGGSGRLEWAAHVDKGRCFACCGAGTVEVNLQALRDEVCESYRIKAEWVLASTEASYVNLSYARLSKIRVFCHAGWSIKAAYPNLHAHWKQVGEPAFQAAQERAREEWEARNRF